MLRKVLKHDLKSVYRLWIVLSVTALVLGVLGGISLRVLLTPAKGPEHFTPYHALSGIFMTLAIIGIVAYLVICYFLVIYRYYQNFFTDEGYLTFTLPASRYTLLNSKLINAFIWQTATGIVFIGCIAIILLIAPSTLNDGSSLLADMLSSVGEALRGIFAFADEWLVIFVICFVLLVLAYYVFSTLLVYLCVTVGCIVAKKAKVLVAILVYYVATTIVSSSSYILIPLGAQIFSALDTVGADIGYGALCLFEVSALMLVTMCISILSIAEYKFILGRIENKLNLA